MGDVCVNMLLNDRLKIIVNFTDANASIIVSVEFVEKVVKWGGATIEVKGLEVTNEFCSDLQQGLRDIIVTGVTRGTLKLTKR